MPADDTVIELVRSVERNLTSRINVHRHELDQAEAERAQLRKDLLDALGTVADRLTAVEKQQLVQNTLMEASQKRMNGVIAVGIGVAIAVLSSAAAVIFFGPGAS